MSGWNVYKEKTDATELIQIWDLYEVLMSKFECNYKIQHGYLDNRVLILASKQTENILTKMRKQT